MEYKSYIHWSKIYISLNNQNRELFLVYTHLVIKQHSTLQVRPIIKSTVR